jgi:hypothetical protein
MPHITDQQKRTVYFEAFGKEYDCKSRKQQPLPLDIAAIVAITVLEDKKKRIETIISKANRHNNTTATAKRWYRLHNERERLQTVINAATLINF